MAQADSLIAQGKRILRSGGDFKEAKAKYIQASEIATQTKNKVQLYKAQLGIAIIGYQSGHYQASFNLADSILQLIPTSEEALIAQYHKLNGNNLVYLGNYSKAYDNQLKALEYFQKSKDNKNLASLHFSIGNNFFYQSHYDLALEHFEKASGIWKKEQDTKGIFWALGAIGSVYEYQSKIKEAIKYSEEALQMAYELDNKPDIAWTLYNLGSISTTNGEIEKALKYIKEANQIAIEIKDYPLIGYTLEGLSKIHIHTQEFDKALELLDQSYNIASENNELATIPTIYQYYAEIHYRKNDLEQYKVYTDKYIILKDSLNNEQLTKTMGSLKKDFEVRELEREKEIELLKKDAKIYTFKRLIFMGCISCVAFIFLLISIFVAKNNRLQKEKNHLLLSSNQKILEQVQQLKTSNRDLKEYANIISHDLKEPLRNIGSFTSLLKRRITTSSIETSKEYMDYIISGVAQMQNLLEDLKSYSVIETSSAKPKMKLNSSEVQHEVINKIRAKYIDKSLTFHSAVLPDVFMSKNHFSTILTNLIDNGIKFNNNHTPVIRIGSYNTDTDHVFSIQDNGIGIDPTFKEKIFVVFQRLNNRENFLGSGIGLSSCKKILNLYSGKIWMESKPGEGSTFFFSIPIESNFKAVKATEETVSY